MPRSGAGAGLSPRPRLYRRMSVLLSGTPTLPTLLRRIPARFCRRPPLPAPAARDTHALLPAAPPHPRLRQGILRHFPGPPPHPRLRQRIPMHFPGTPTPPAPSQISPIPLLSWHPLPHPRLRRLPPAGGGSAHDIRAVTWGGADGQPCTDRGGYRVWERADGSKLVPPPRLPRSIYLTSHRLLPCLQATQTLCRHPPHPRLRRSSPAPSRSRAVPGRISGEQPCPVFLRDLPVHRIVVAIAMGETTRARINNVRKDRVDVVVVWWAC